jgi:hypothetical protein
LFMTGTVQRTWALPAGASEEPVRGDRQVRDEGCRLALQRLEVKQRVITDLIAGRLSLLEATARFRAVQSERAPSGAAAARAVIGWVHLALCDRPERAEAVSEELEQQLCDHLTLYG